MTRTYDASTLSKVKEALCWAYRSGYAQAIPAAEELAASLGETVGKRTLGAYGDTLEFIAPPEDPVPA